MLTRIRMESVKTSVISVKLGMTKLDIVSVVSKVMDIQSKVCAAVLQ